MVASKLLWGLLAGRGPGLGAWREPERPAGVRGSGFWGGNTARGTAAAGTGPSKAVKFEGAGDIGRDGATAGFGACRLVLGAGFEACGLGLGAGFGACKVVLGAGFGACGLVLGAASCCGGRAEAGLGAELPALGATPLKVGRRSSDCWGPGLLALGAIGRCGLGGAAAGVASSSSGAGTMDCGESAGPGPKF